MKEVIVLSAILAVVFLVGITRVSFALEDIQDKDGILETRKNILVKASELYAKEHAKDLKEENYIYGSDLIEENYIFDLKDVNLKDAKIKILKNDKNEYTIEVVE